MQASKNDKSRGLNELYEVYLFFVPKLRDKHKKTFKGKNKSQSLGWAEAHLPILMQGLPVQRRQRRQPSQPSPRWVALCQLLCNCCYIQLRSGSGSALPVSSPRSTKYSWGCLASAEVEEGFAPPVWGMHSFRSFLVSAQTTELWKCFFTFGWSMGGRDLVLRVAYDKGLTWKVLLDTK